MNRLIVQLMVIREFCKDIHYNVSGLCAISLHKYADEVQENISEYIDSIKEICLLGMGQRPLTSKEYMQEAVNNMFELPASDKEKFEMLHDILQDTINLIQDMQLNKAEDNLLSTIAEDLQKSVGLINLIIE